MPYDTKGVMNINGALFLLQISASLANVFAVINVGQMHITLYMSDNIYVM